MPDLEQLRDNLVGLRAGAVQLLCDRVDAGMVATLAHTDLALAALDRMPLGEAMAAERVVVGDDGIGPIAILSYTGAEAVAAVPVTPHRALALAAELIAAAGRRLLQGNLNNG